MKNAAASAPQMYRRKPCKQDADSAKFPSTALLCFPAKERWRDSLLHEKRAPANRRSGSSDLLPKRSDRSQSRPDVPFCPSAAVHIHRENGFLHRAESAENRADGAAAIPPAKSTFLHAKKARAKSADFPPVRSEERRVGKECSSRGEEYP